MAMTDRRCEACRWWDNSSSSAHVMAEVETGYCRRSPPGFDDRTGVAVWPFTADDDWCGEFSDRSALPVEDQETESHGGAVAPERKQYFYDVPEAGALLGLTRNASYKAAKRGELGDVVVIGKLIRVNRLAFHKKFKLPLVQP